MQLGPRHTFFPKNIICGNDRKKKNGAAPAKQFDGKNNDNNSALTGMGLGRLGVVAGRRKKSSLASCRQPEG